MNLLKNQKVITKRNDKKNFSKKIIQNFQELLLIIYYFVSNFITEIKKKLIEKVSFQQVDQKHPPLKKGKLSVSELITLGIFRNFTGHSNWKSFYLHIVNYHQKDFLKIPNYQNFVKGVNKVTILGKKILDFFLSFFHFKTDEKSLKITDSTRLKVCENKRIFNHKVAQGFAKRGKSSLGWFYGFKLHIICNEKMEILRANLTSGNTDDRQGLRNIWNNVFGMILADAGYVGKKVFQEAWEKGIHLFTCVRANMKKMMSKADQELFRKRNLVETVFSVLKSRMNLETS
jgi:transposase